MTVEQIETGETATSERRKFGVVMSVVLALLGGLFLWRGRGYCWCFFALSLLFAGGGLILPAALGPVHAAWMKLSAVMGWFMSRVILLILFYLVLTPTSLLLRLFGKDILSVEFKQSPSESYWISKKVDGSQPRDYKNQF